MDRARRFLHSASTPLASCYGRRSNSAAPEEGNVPAQEADGASSSRQQDISAGSAPPPPVTSFPPEWKLPSIEELMEQRKELFTPEEKDEAFALLSGFVKKYTDEMIDRWNTEIDTYLVYISLQLGSLAIHPPFINSTQPAFGSSDAARAGPAPGPPPDAATVAINTLWFSSLVLSLSSASVGIMVKQWLNEFKSGLPSDKTPSEKGESRKGRETLESARLRQYRLNNLEKWRVDLVVLAVPILLQLALGFFLAGLLVLVWTLNHTVAAVTTSFVLLLTIFTLGTMLLPAFKQSCAYLSPQALLFDSASRWIRYIVLRLIWIPSVLIYWSVKPWRHTGVVSTFLRCVRAVADNVSDWSYCTPPLGWRTREKDAISASKQRVDAYLVAKAYDASLADPNILDAAAKWLSDAEGRTVLQAFDRLRAVATKHFGSGPYQQVIALGKSSAPILWWNTVLCHLLAVNGSGSYKLSGSALDELGSYLCEGVNRHGQAPNDVLDARWSSDVFAAVLMPIGSSDRREDSQSARDALFAIFNILERSGILLHNVEKHIHSWKVHLLAVLAWRVRHRLSTLFSQPLSGDGLEDVLSLTRKLMVLHTRIFTDPDASEEHRTSLSAWSGEAFREVGDALERVDCSKVTWVLLWKLAEILEELVEVHTLTTRRPPIRLDFVVTLRNFLDRVKSRPDWDDGARNEIRTCESTLKTLESILQSDNTAHEATESHSGTVVDPASTSHAGPSELRSVHRQEEQIPGPANSESSESKSPNALKPARTETTSSPASPPVNSPVAPAPVSQSILSEAVNSEEQTQSHLGPAHLSDPDDPRPVQTSSSASAHVSSSSGQASASQSTPSEPVLKQSVGKADTASLSGVDDSRPAPASSSGPSLSAPLASVTSDTNGLVPSPSSSRQDDQKVSLSKKVGYGVGTATLAEPDHSHLADPTFSAFSGVSLPPADPAGSAFASQMPPWHPLQDEGNGCAPTGSDRIEPCDEPARGSASARPASPPA
ncbi:hypothetical protein OH77DRAFT_1020108 [Trametes cingulata]|nr:hypothetical protein OH77DRAFT_1020108 [Trametes cingulata]